MGPETFEGLTYWKRTYRIHSLPKKGHYGMGSISHQQTMWFKVKRRALNGYHSLGRQQKEILYQGLPSEENNQNVKMLRWVLNSFRFTGFVNIIFHWKIHENARKKTRERELMFLLVPKFHCSNYILNLKQC